MRKAGLVSAATAAMMCCIALAGCTPSAEQPSADAAPTTSAQMRSATEMPSATPDAAAPRIANSGSDVPIVPLDESIESPSGAPTDVAPMSPSRCVDQQLTLRYAARPQDSGAGNWYADLVFTNVSATDCSFDGWPGLIAQDAFGVQLGAPAHIEGETSEPVVLRGGGGVATANLHGTNPGAYGCPATISTTLRAYITTDGTGSGVVVTQTIPVCSDGTATLGVGPLVAG